jgi:hypothetical protein
MWGLLTQGQSQSMIEAALSRTTGSDDTSEEGGTKHRILSWPSGGGGGPDDWH